MPQLMGLCMKARDSIGLLFTYTDSQVPMRYLQVISIIVWTHNFIQCLNSAVTISNAWLRDEPADIAVELILLVAYPMVYLALLHVGAGMLCPLQDKNDVDLPHGAFSYWMIRENRSFSEASCLPRGPPYGRPPLWRAPTGERPSDL